MLHAVAEAPAPYDPTPPERDVWDLWERQAPGSNLETGNGPPLKLVFSGRRGHGPGPDFRDALLKTRDGRLVLGDVEVHRTGRGWRDHGHASDPAYDGVLLHVVFHHGCAAVPLSLGVQAPTVSLEGASANPLSEPPSFPCHDLPLRMAPSLVADHLQRAGLARFREKSRRMRLRLSSLPADEVFYGGLMDALGYHANRAPMRALAQSLPFAVLRAEALRVPGRDRLAWLEERLLTAAGLREAPVGSGFQPAVESADWRRAGMRPSNQPERRLRGGAALLHRALPRGPVETWRGWALQGPKALTKALTVEGEGASALVGKDRALEIAVNAALTGLHALALARRDRAEAGRLLEIYGELPAGADNELAREVRRRTGLTGGAQGRRSAATEQGLLHLYRHGCRWLACGSCPLAGPKANA